MFQCFFKLRSQLERGSIAILILISVHAVHFNSNSVSTKYETVILIMLIHNVILIMKRSHNV